MEHSDDGVNIVDYEQKCYCVLIIGSFNQSEINNSLLLSCLKQLLHSVSDDSVTKGRLEFSIICLGNSKYSNFISKYVHTSQIPMLDCESVNSVGTAFEKASRLISERKEYYKNNGIPYYRPWIYWLDNSLSDHLLELSYFTETIIASENSKEYIFETIDLSSGLDEVACNRLMNQLRISKFNPNTFSETFKFLSASYSAILNDDWCVACEFAKSDAGDEVGNCDIINDNSVAGDWLDEMIIGIEEDNNIKNPIHHEPITWKKADALKTSLWSRLFKNLKSVYSSVFAPAEVAPKQHMMVQVYLHLPEETEKVKGLATEADKNAERRGYEPLEVKLKDGDSVEIELNINGDTLLYNERKTVTWQGSFVKRAFDYLVPSDINLSELSCSVNIFVNGAIAGEMIFLTSIVDSPRQLNTNVHAKPTKKLFISYSHKDIKSAERIVKIHEALGIDVFFDKHRLKAGYIYSEEISRFIQTADTFVLCWSENAAQSEYVQKERQEALALAYPQRQPREHASLSIRPFNIEPHAAPPADMKEHYHFEEL